MNIRNPLPLVTAAALAVLIVGPPPVTRAQEPQDRRPAMQEAAWQMRPQLIQRLLDTRVMDADIRFLSHDLLEGRAPSGRGEAIAVEYIEARLRMAGADGAFADGSFRQAVPLIKQRASSDMELTVRRRGQSATYTFGSQFVVDSGVYEPLVEVDGEIVFVGYGAVAPEYEWDDYKKVDVNGKILMMVSIYEMKQRYGC